MKISRMKVGLLRVKRLDPQIKKDDIILHAG